MYVEVILPKIFVCCIPSPCLKKVVQCSLEGQRYYLPLFLHKAVLEMFNFQLTGTLESHTLFLTAFIYKRKEINDCPKELRKTQTEKYNSLFDQIC